MQIYVGNAVLSLFFFSQHLFFAILKECVCIAFNVHTLPIWKGTLHLHWNNDSWNCEKSEPHSLLYLICCSPVEKSHSMQLLLITSTHKENYWLWMRIRCSHSHWHTVYWVLLKHLHFPCDWHLNCDMQYETWAHTKSASLISKMHHAEHLNFVYELAALIFLGVLKPVS